MGDQAAGEFIRGTGLAFLCSPFQLQIRIAIAQINCLVGDLAGNARRILDAAIRAQALGANLLVTPELALCGYPPEDLLLRPDFYRAAARELSLLAEAAASRAPGIALLVGHPEENAKGRFNAASLLRDGRIETTYRKCLLPNSEVFDEERYFDAGTLPCVITINGVRCGVNICEDVWAPGAPEAARHAGAEILLALNASPYHLH